MNTETILNPKITFEEFVAGARPVSDEVWGEIVDGDLAPGVARENFVEHPGGTAMYFHEGQWWPFAWWYKPVAHATKESAQVDLFKWYNEFA